MIKKQKGESSQKEESKNVKWVNQYPSPILSINTGITTNYNIFLYSPDFQNCLGWPPYNLKVSTTITMTGFRTKDYSEAEKNTGVLHEKGRTTWHHLWVSGSWNDMCVMQLLNTTGHRETCPHSGSGKQYANMHSLPKYGVISENSASSGKITYSNLKVPTYSNDVLYNFEKNVLSQYGLKIPSFLYDAYLTGGNFLEKGFYSSDINAEFDFYALLTEKESTDTISIEYILKANSKKEVVPPPTKTALPFGIDACGNLFYADIQSGPVVWFQDHEDYDDKTMFTAFKRSI